MHFKWKNFILDGVATKRDFVELDYVTYELLPLNPLDEKIGRGINSSVFFAKRADDDDNECLVIKICNFSDETESEKNLKRIKRFEREIEALKKVRSMSAQNRVVELITDGKIEFNNRHYRCYIMEKGDYTLNGFLENEQDLGLQQKLLLCLELLHSFKQLHEVGIYHRDIKPENILSCNGIWKVADLGLIAYRNEDFSIDEYNEKIGPWPWMSPEAANKKLALQHCITPYNIDCCIDNKSDVFQLGKIFWFILQGEIPNGILTNRDLHITNDAVYGNLLKPALCFNKSDRPTISELINKMRPLSIRYGL